MAKKSDRGGIHIVWGLLEDTRRLHVKPRRKAAYVRTVTYVRSVWLLGIPQPGPWEFGSVYRLMYPFYRKKGSKRVHFHRVKSMNTHNWLINATGYARMVAETNQIMEEEYVALTKSGALQTFDIRFEEDFRRYGYGAAVVRSFLRLKGSSVEEDVSEEVGI